MKYSYQIILCNYSIAFRIKKTNKIIICTVRMICRLYVDYVILNLLQKKEIIATLTLDLLDGGKREAMETAHLETKLNVSLPFINKDKVFIKINAK